MVWGVSKRLRYLLSAKGRLSSDTPDWKLATARVLANPKYEGLMLAQQIGLVPLGPDPASGLEEFADLSTGVAPRRSPKSEKLLLTAGTGVVFVLLPGDTFLMGAQKNDPQERNFDPEIWIGPGAGGSGNWKVTSVTLKAFFLSKYEMTQGQWIRGAGLNPSRYIAGPRDGLIPNPLLARSRLLHPVEQVSYKQSRALLSHFGFSLPTEAQWEYACRSGTNSIWWTGNEREDLLGARESG